LKYVICSITNSLFPCARAGPNLTSLWVGYISTLFPGSGAGTFFEQGGRKYKI